MILYQNFKANGDSSGRLWIKTTRSVRLLNFRNCFDVLTRKPHLRPSDSHEILNESFRLILSGHIKNSGQTDISRVINESTIWGIFVRTTETNIHPCCISFRDYFGTISGRMIRDGFRHFSKDTISKDPQSTQTQIGSLVQLYEYET